MLRKRENYREHFHAWDIEQIARMTDDELEAILLDPGIVRNRLKVYSVRKNARIALDLQREFGSLDRYFWSYTEDAPIIHHPSSLSDILTESHISRAISKDLKRRGMSFVGSTIIYAWMQAIGMVDDHIIDCTYKNKKSQL